MVAEALLEAAAAGTAPPAEAYAPDVVLEAHLPGRHVLAVGIAAVRAETARWFRAPGAVTFREERPGSDGTVLRLERLGADGRRVRLRHLLHLADGRIHRQYVYPERPLEEISSPLPRTEDPAVRGSLSRVVGRTAVGPGISGTPVERLELDDGTAVFAKHLQPNGSWTMRATQDAGREASLWRDGVLDELGTLVEHGVVGAVPEGEGWLLLSRDLSGSLTPFGAAGPDPDRVREVVGRVHARFEGRPPAGLCRPADRIGLFSPATAQREREEPDLAPKVIGRGWELFAELAPDDVVAAVRAVHADPAGLSEALSSSDRPTLLHGDLRPVNLGLREGRPVILDWGLATAGPPALDLLWYAFNLATVASGIAEAVDRLVPEGVTERTAPALLATLAQCGCYLGFEAVQSVDAGARERASSDLDAWCELIRRALERWSPP